MSNRMCLERLERRVLFSGGSFVFAVTAGGPGKDRTNDVASDRAGNSYVCGVYNGPVDFDPSAGRTILPGTGSDDAFVAKYGPGGKLLWAKALTGAGTQEIQAIAVDGAGNVYATGYFVGAVDFDPGPGVHKLTSAGAEDGFVLKLSSSGTYLWARQFAGAGRQGGVAVTADGGGNVYVQGMFNAPTDFGPAAGAAKLTPAGGFDDFLVKLSPAGTLLFARKFGGAGDEFANGVAVDRSGNIVTTGTFTGKADFDPGAGVATLTSAGGTDVFVSKVSAAGNYLFAKRFGGAANDGAGDVGLDPAGNILITGRFSGTADFDPGPGVMSLSSGAGTAAFVVKLSQGGALSWAKKVSGTRFVGGNDLVVDAGGNVYLAGAFAGTADFDPGPAVVNLASIGGSNDIFVARLTSSGGFVWAKRLGGPTSLDEGEGIALAPAGGVFFGGSFGGTVDFDPGPGSVLRTAAGSQADLFLCELV